MMDGWKIQELRAAVLSDLHEFIPRGHYSNVRKDVDIALNDYVLANRLKCAQYTAPQFTPRQLAAVWLLEKIGMYCIPYTSPDPEADAAEGITPESFKETSLEHLHDALKRYAAHLGAEENNALIPADALASVEQAATDATGKAVPGTTSAPVMRVNKLRRNVLSPVIDEAIKLAGNTELADVYLKLKELAKDEKPPFTGVFDGDALCYTDTDDELAKLTKEALGKRLKRKTEKPAAN